MKQIQVLTSIIQMNPSNTKNINPSSSILVTLVFLAICLARQTEAGGKGKGGRQGHIIIQNEVKGQQVPVYMPIPIPIPMPIGPPQGAKFPSHHPSMGLHHHQQQQQQLNDGDGEVRKIYLLQPVSKPQPQLKGGGFMGPAVQTHIHLPGSMVGHPPKFGRLAPKYQHHHHHQQPDTYGSDLGAPPSSEHHGGGTKSSQNEVKILPIVVIPPIAPMPPIQLPTHSSQMTPKMTLTPQFNNYVVAGGSASERKRLSNSLMSLANHNHDQSSFADYGGSVGGSLFRETYAGGKSPRSMRIRNLQRIHRLQELPSSSSRSSYKSRDYDYGDIDYNENTHSSASSSTASRYGDYQPSARLVAQQQQQHRRYNGNHNGNGNGNSHGLGNAKIRSRSRHYNDGQLSGSGAGRQVNSIRDIVEQASTQFDDDPQIVDQFVDQNNNDDARNRPLAGHQLDYGLQQDNGGGLDFQGEPPLLPPKSSRTSRNQYNSLQQQQQTEISLDDLRSQIERDIGASGNRDQHQHQNNYNNEVTTRQQNDLSSLYYDRDVQQTTTDKRQWTEPSGNRLRQYRGGRQSIYGGPPDDGQRDLLDEDEWRFDSIKSVTHMAAKNDTMTIRDLKLDASRNSTDTTDESRSPTLKSTNSTLPIEATMATI